MLNYLKIFFMSMIPIVELRGAVIYSQYLGLPIVPSYIVCILGNLLPMPLVYLFAREILIRGQNIAVIGPVFKWMYNKGEKAGAALAEKAGRKGIFIALMLFVGIPLPGTGAWTGTLAASILDVGIKTTAAAVTLGVILAGVIMMSAGVLGFSLL